MDGWMGGWMEVHIVPDWREPIHPGDWKLQVQEVRVAKGTESSGTATTTPTIVASTTDYSEMLHPVLSQYPHGTRKLIDLAILGL
jgi:hypothetical protein